MRETRGNRGRCLVQSHPREEGELFFLEDQTREEAFVGIVVGNDQEAFRETTSAFLGIRHPVLGVFLGYQMAAEDKEKEMQLYKVLVIGDYAVGKTRFVTLLFFFNNIFLSFFLLSLSLSLSLILIYLFLILFRFQYHQTVYRRHFQSQVQADDWG